MSLFQFDIEFLIQPCSICLFNSELNTNRDLSLTDHAYSNRIALVLSPGPQHCTAVFESDHEQGQYVSAIKKLAKNTRAEFCKSVLQDLDGCYVQLREKSNESVCIIKF